MALGWAGPAECWLGLTVDPALIPVTARREPITPATDRPIASFVADLRERRVVGRCKHELMDVFLVVLCGIISGADDFVSIEAYPKTKEQWLRERLGLKLR